MSLAEFTRELNKHHHKLSEDDIYSLFKVAYLAGNEDADNQWDSGYAFGSSEFKESWKTEYFDDMASVVEDIAVAYAQSPYEKEKLQQLLKDYNFL